MEWAQDILDKIDQYLQGKGNVADRQWIESKIKTDPNFSAKVEEIRTLTTSSRVTKLKDQFASLQDLEKKIEKKSTDHGDLLENDALSLKATDNTQDQKANTTTMNNQTTSNVEYQDRDKFYAGIRAHMGKQLFQQLQELEEEVNESISETSPSEIENRKSKIPIRKKFGRRILISLATAACVGLLIVFNWDRLRPMSEGEKLFWEEFEPYPYSDQVRSERKTEFTELDQALAYYVQGDYRKAVRIFDRLDLNELSEEQRLAAAYSYLGNKDCEKAVELKKELWENINWKNKIEKLCIILNLD